MKGLIYLSQPLRHLSLDVVAGALLSGAALAHLMQVPMPWTWWVALPASVWLIYTLDHLMDAYRLKADAHTARHLFHHRYFAYISGVWGLVFFLCVGILPWYMPEALVRFGGWMGLGVLAHLSLVLLVRGRISAFIQKELGVGLIYSLGVTGPPMILFGDQVRLVHLLIAFQLLLLALANLLLFSLYERESDQKDGHTSLARALGGARTRQAITLLTALCTGLSGYVLFSSPSLPFWVMEGCFWAMGLIFLLLAFLPKAFRKHELYRILGDGAFLLPGIVLCL